METKCGNQTLHGKCYLCTKPGCSGAANNATANYSALMELSYFFGTSQFHCTQATATVLSQNQDRPSLEGATLSLCKYASELVGYGVNSVIARSIFLFLYMSQGRNHDETFV